MSLMKIMGFSFLAAALLLLVVNLHMQLHPLVLENVLARLQILEGTSAIVLFCILYVVGNLLLLPIGLPLNLIAGLLWGTFAGGVLINLLAIFVATLSFLMARRARIYFLPKGFEKYISLVKLKNVINRYDWQFIFLARMNPIIPFGMSNYVFGFIPELSFKNYIVATAISNLLPCFAVASLGSVLRISSLKNTNISHVIFNIGMAFMLIALVFIMRVVIQKKQSQDIMPHEG